MLDGAGPATGWTRSGSLATVSVVETKETGGTYPGMKVAINKNADTAATRVITYTANVAVNGVQAGDWYEFGCEYIVEDPGGLLVGSVRIPESVVSGQTIIAANIDSTNLTNASLNGDQFKIRSRRAVMVTGGNITFPLKMEIRITPGAAATNAQANIYFRRAYFRKVKNVAVGTITLTLTPSQISDLAAQGSVIGAVSNLVAGGTVTVTDSSGGRVQFNSGTGNLEAGPNPYNFTLAEQSFSVSLSSSDGTTTRTGTFSLAGIAGIPVASTAPAISGTLTVGQVLACGGAVWTNSGVPSEWQWYRANDAAGAGEVAISGATAQTYTLVTADDTKFIRCRERAVITGNVGEAFTARTAAVSATDTTAPTITVSVLNSATGAQNSTLNAGDVINARLTFSENVIVTGTPQLALNIGGTTVQANYASGSGTAQLIFSYTILSGQTDANGISIGANALSLNGGTIRDGAANNAVLTAGAVTDDAAYLVDTTGPTITSSASVSVAENVVLAHSLTASETVSWSIVGGADQARFELSGSTLRWLSNGTKDYEAPNDADTNNTYFVTVRATDQAGNATDQIITATVTDASESTTPVWNNTVNVGSPAHLAYSAGDTIVATTASIAGQRAARGNVAITSGQKKHFCIRPTETSGALSVTTRVGVCTSAVGGSTNGTNGTTVAYLTATGFATFTGTANQNISLPFASGDKVDIEVDRTANVIRWSVNGSAWSADKDISGLTGDIFIYGSLENDTDIALELLAEAAFGKSMTSGFTAG